MIYTSTNGSRWNVHYEALPIPDRSHDWQATHSDYDGAPDAGDAKRLHVAAATRDALIDCIEARCACGLERLPGAPECHSCESDREADMREDIRMDRGEPDAVETEEDEAAQ